MKDFISFHLGRVCEVLTEEHPVISWLSHLCSAYKISFILQWRALGWSEYLKTPWRDFCFLQVTSLKPALKLLPLLLPERFLVSYCSTWHLSEIINYGMSNTVLSLLMHLLTDGNVRASRPSAFLELWNFCPWAQCFLIFYYSSWWD